MVARIILNAVERCMSILNIELMNLVLHLDLDASDWLQNLLNGLNPIKSVRSGFKEHNAEHSKALV